MKRLQSTIFFLLLFVVGGSAQIQEAEIDPIRWARFIARGFFEASDALDDYRLRHYMELRKAERAQLKAQAQALAVCGQQYTADALGGRLRVRRRCMKLLRKEAK